MLSTRVCISAKVQAESKSAVLRKGYFTQRVMRFTRDEKEFFFTKKNRENAKRKTRTERIVVHAECHRSNLGCSTRASLIQLIQKVILSLFKESSSLARLVLVARSPRPRCTLASSSLHARLVVVVRSPRLRLSLASFLSLARLVLSPGRPLSEEPEGELAGF